MSKLDQNVIEINKVLNAVDDATNGYDFSFALAKAKSQYKFKCSISAIYQLSQLHALDSFVVSCYRVVMAQYLFQKLSKKHKNKNSQQQLVKAIIKIREYAAAQSIILKQEYCIVMEKIKQRKSQEMEFILFLIYFLFRDALNTFCTKFEILKLYFSDSLQIQNEELQNIACACINLQITGVSIRANIYKCLKKKYYKNIQHPKRRHRKANTESQLTPFLKSLIPFYKHSHNEQKQNKSRQVLLTEKQKEFKLEIGAIFQKDNRGLSPKSDISCDLKKTQISIKPSSSTAVLTDFKNSLKSSRYHSMGNSDAFMKSRNHFCTPTEKKTKENNNNYVKMEKLNKIEILKSKNKENRRQLGLNLMSTSFKMFFMKNDKKSPSREIQKCSVAEWQKRVIFMKSEQGIEKAMLGKMFRKGRKATYGSEQQFDKIADNLQMTYKKNPRVITRQKSQRESITRQGFCQFIDQREANQIGIVRSIVNFANSTEQKKHKKLCCKEIKDEYRQFNNKMQQYYQQYIDDNNYIYRLQKAITGTNKF